MQDSHFTFLWFIYEEWYMFLEHQDSELSTLSQDVIVSIIIIIICIIISCGRLSGLAQLA